MQVLKITTSDIPDYSLVVEQGKDWQHSLESILEGHPMFDGVVPLGVGDTLDIHIEVIEMTKEAFDALETLEP